METLGDEIPQNLVEVGMYSTERDGFDHGLVSLMLGHPFWLVPSNRSFQLLVEPAVAKDVLEQLAKYDRESVGWPPRPVVPDPDTAKRSVEFFTPMLWCLSVLLVFRAQAEWPWVTDAGMVDARAVISRGEIWRAATALFLHGDLGHLTSNLISGIFVFSAVLTTMGRLRGWLLIGASAVLGNLAAASLNVSNAYHSLGASTAVFAALGLLTGRAVRVLLKADHPHRGRALFGALAAGATILALYGAGGQQVDVLAHLTGFISGTIFGVIASVVGREKLWSAAA